MNNKACRIRITCRENKMKTPKLNSKAQTISFETENNIEKAIKIWHNKLTPMQRIDLRNQIGADKYSQISRMYNACINHIADNLEKYA